MSASTQAAPRQISFGRLPSALAMLALVVIIAAAVAIVALNGTKAAAPVTSGAKGQPPPAVIDHGWSSAQNYGPVAIPKGTSPYGGFGGPRVAPVYKGDNSKDDRYLISNSPYTTGAPHGMGLGAQ